MTSITSFPVSIQASADSVPSLPCWFGEVTLLAQHLHCQGVLAAIEEQVRFARRRFGRYEVIDFVAVLFGYAISGERTLEAFYERLSPWAAAFMALFGRKRGEVVRTRSTVLQAHTHQWLGSFGNSGNGQYREELRRAVAAIQCYLQAHQLPQERALVRLDGLYGMGAVLADLAGFSFVTRGKDYTVLDRAEIQSRLHLPADQQFSRPESDLVRTLYDCPLVPVGPDGQRCRVVVATHPASEKQSRVGRTRSSRPPLGARLCAST